MATSKENLGTGPESSEKQFVYAKAGHQLPGECSGVPLGECLGQQALEWACLSWSWPSHFPSCVALGRAMYLSEPVYSSKTWVMIPTQESHCEDLNSPVKTQYHGLRKCFKNISFY